MTRVGFEPTKIKINGFTARHLWPLSHRVNAFGSWYQEPNAGFSADPETGRREIQMKFLLFYT